MRVNEPLPDGRGRGRSSQAQAARLKALYLRQAGATYRQIADATGRSLGWAHKAVHAALEGLQREKAEQVMELELARLDRMQQRHFLAAVGGDRASTHTVLKIMDRRAKYLSLDNPAMADAVAEGTTLLAGLAAQIAMMPDTYEPVSERREDDDAV